MNSERTLKKLGKKHRVLLKILDSKPLDPLTAELVKHVIRGLENLNLVRYEDGFLVLSSFGRDFIDEHRSELFQTSLESNVETINRLIKAIPSKPLPNPLQIKKREYLFLRFIERSARKLNEIRGAKSIIPGLLERQVISLQEGIISLTKTGRRFLARFPESIPGNEASAVFLAAQRMERKRALKEKAEVFLSLYRRGLTYQEIGELHGLTRERVRQILNETPNFGRYLVEYEQAKARRKLEKKEELRMRNLEKSLAVRYPDRIDELWDREKNAGLDPAKIPARSTLVEIWLKCPKDGFSWKKKPSDIVHSWEHNKTSGCPVCAGKTKKAQKQKTLVEVYPEIIARYWDYKKNDSLLNPENLTLGSNRKVWLACPIDGHEWLASIAVTVKQQWSKGNAGCRVCNGTLYRKQGVRSKAKMTVQEKFPEQVSKFWDFEKNDSLGLNPGAVTSGSGKRAWFICPIDGHRWQTMISIIGNCWLRGNSGCPICRGSRPSKNNSLALVYPHFVASIWDYAKNKALNLDLENLTLGSAREAWFKCPVDGSEWRFKINYIVRKHWKAGRSGCPTCGKLLKTTAA